MATVLAAISPAALQALALPLACSGAAALAYALLLLFKAMRQKTTAPIQAGRPFTLQAALTLALVAAAALIAAAALDAWLGPRGITVAAVLGGLVDTHAAAASVAALAAADRIDPAQTVVPVLAALSANAASKAVYAVVSGGRRYAVQVIPGLLLMIAAAWAATRRFERDGRRRPRRLGWPGPGSGRRLRRFPPSVPARVLAADQGGRGRAGYVAGHFSRSRK